MHAFRVPDGRLQIQHSNFNEAVQGLSQSAASVCIQLLEFPSVFFSNSGRIAHVIPQVSVNFLGELNDQVLLGLNTRRCRGWGAAAWWGGSDERTQVG